MSIALESWVLDNPASFWAIRRRAAKMVLGGEAAEGLDIARTKIYHRAVMSSADTEMTVKGPDFATSLLWALNAKRLIAQRVGRRMEEMGYATDEALAHDAHVTVKTVWRLRNGKSYPRDDTARKIAAALNMEVSDLRPPQSPEDDPDLREQLHEVLSRLQRIELAVGVDPELVISDLEQDEETVVRDRADSSDAPSEAPERESES